MTRLAGVQQKAKERYDEGRREVTYEKGDLALVYRPHRKLGKSDKLNHYWIGPYEIQRQLTPVNYEVKMAGKKKSDVVHIASMKPFKEDLLHEELTRADESIRHDEETTELVPPTDSVTADNPVTQLSAPAALQKKRGRPKKSKPSDVAIAPTSQTESGEPIKGVSTSNHKPKKRGWPMGNQSLVPATTSAAEKKKRGRPPKDKGPSLSKNLQREKQRLLNLNSEARPQRTRQAPDRLGIGLQNEDYDDALQCDDPDKNVEENIRPDIFSPRPKRYGNSISQLISTVMVLLCLIAYAQAKGRIIHKGGIIFQEKTQVAFSESSWTLITTYSWDRTGRGFVMIGNWLDHQFQDISKVPATTNNRSVVTNSARATILERLLILESAVKIAKTRFNVMDNVVEPRRHKRGLFDAAGSGLKWLFGTATQSDLEELSKRVEQAEDKQSEVITLIKQQASAINESLWETRETTKIIRLLTTKTDQTARIAYTTQEGVVTAMRLIEFETILSQFWAELNWLTDFTTDLEIGLATLAQGKLPPQLFRPTSLKVALQKVAAEMPERWQLSLANEKEIDLWTVYREAVVVTALEAEQR